METRKKNNDVKTVLLALVCSFNPTKVSDDLVWRKITNFQC